MTAPDREGAAVEALLREMQFRIDNVGPKRVEGREGDWPYSRYKSPADAALSAVIAAGWVPQSEVTER